MKISLSDSFRALGRSLLLLATLFHSSAFAEVVPEYRGLNSVTHPSVNEIRALGQLGGALHPVRLSKNRTESPAGTTANWQDNKAFAQAMDLWNTHAYTEAKSSFIKYLDQNPSGLWAGEAALHLGCEARFNGRLSESERYFTRLISAHEDSSDPDSKMIAEKAKSRLAEQRLLQNDREEAAALFSELATSAVDWRHRTYASHWIQRISRERQQGVALANCGTQALAHLLEQNGKTQQAEVLLSKLPSTLDGFNLTELGKLAAQYGYQAVPLSLSVDDLSKLSYPAIAHIARGETEKTGHYWVLESLDKGKLTIYDVQEQRRFIQTLDEFSREWAGNLLAFSVTEDLESKQLAQADADLIFGACCGVQRAESDLGPANECDLESRGCPDWSVNMLNLNLYMTDTPIWYTPAYGPKVSIRLSYNSQSAIARNEIFGNKWSFDYGGYIVEDPGNTVTAFLGNGKRIVFTKNTDGSYQASRGNYEILTKVDISTYELKFRDGTIHYFAIPAGTHSQQPFLTQVKNLQGDSLSFEYDQMVRLTGIVDAQGRRTEFEYNSDGRVAQVTDPFGRFAQFNYDMVGNLVQIVDMGGYTSQMTYDEGVYLTSLTKPESGTWEFYIEPADGIRNASNAYPNFGAPMWEDYRITVTDPNQNKEEYYYNGYSGYSWHVAARDYNHSNPRTHLNSSARTLYHFNRPTSRLTKITHPGGETFTFNYNSYGSNTVQNDGVVLLNRAFNASNQKIAETINPNSNHPRTTQYEYQSPTSYLRTKILKPSVASGQQVEQTIEYDSAGNPTLVTLHGFTPDGMAITRSYQYTYDSLGRLIEEKGPRTDVTDITHYAYYNCDPSETDGYCDRLATITNALGHTTTINSYTDNGLVSQVTDPNGKITLYSYDGLDRLVSVTERTELMGTDHTTLFTYTGPKRLASVTLPDGTSLTYAYDSTEKLVSITDSQGNKIEYLYDANGNRLEEKVFDTSNTLVRSVTNAYDLRNRRTSVSSGGIITQYGAYRNHLLGRITDGRNHATVQEYDGFGELVKITPPVGSQITYQYDVHGNLTQAAVTNGPVTQYFYDDLGNLLKEISPDRGTTSWSYDLAGNRITQVDGRGVAIHYNYDALNRLTQENHPDGSLIAYQYDTAPNGIGRLATVSDLSGSTAFAYNKLGQMVQKTQSVVVASGSVVLTMQFEYDTAGRLMQKTYPSGLEVGYGYDALGRIAQIELDGQPWLTEIRYQPFGGVTEQHWADGRITVRSYDTGGKLTEHSLDTDQRWLSYDLSGNIQGLSDSSASRSFDYDPVNRLIFAQGFAEELAWQYDGNSNRTSEQQGASIDTYIYADQTNRLLEISSAGTSQFAYDGAGNMSSNGSKTYSYNMRGQLSAVSDGTNETASYLYNAFNQRVLKVVDGQERIFVYDTDGMLLSEHDSSGKPIVQYVNFNGQVLAASTVAQTSAPTPSCQGITARVSDHLGALRVYVTTELINGIVTASYRAHGSHDRLGSDALAVVTLYANGFNYWQVTDPGNCASPTVGGCPATTSTNQEHTDQQRAYAQTAAVWWWLPATTTYYAQGSDDNLGTSGTTLTTLYQGANGSWHKTDPANCPLEQASGWLYYHNDHLGTPQKVTDAEGEVVWEATVNPFGEVIETVTDFEQNIRFPGQYHDRETGLYYNWHRYYSPELGRYITSDPIGLAGGMNTYSYVGGNPVGFVDPMGLITFDFTKFANDIEQNRFDLTVVLGTLAATETLGTMPKTISELRGLGVPKAQLNPYTSQLSRWSGRFKTRVLRVIGRTTTGVFVGTAATGALIFEGFYDWGVIGIAAWNAISFDDLGCGN